MQTWNFVKLVKQNRIMAFSLVMCTFLLIIGLGRASVKDFWQDEHVELDAVINAPVTEMFLSGVKTPSLSPLYYAVQKQFVKAFWGLEYKTGYGLDWRVSARFWPAFSLVFSILLSCFLFVRLGYPWLAAFLPITISSQLPLWAITECRIYSTWLGVSLIFYVASVFLILGNPSRSLYFLWVICACLLPLIQITSIAQVMTTSVVLLLVMNFDKDQKELKAANPVIFLGMALSILFYSIYNNAGSLEGNDFRALFINIKQLKDLWLTRLVFISFLLLGLGTSSLKHKKLYFATGALTLSQVFVVIMIYSAQISLGYFFNKRHGIFITGMQAIALAVLVFAIIEIILTWTESKGFKDFNPKIYVAASVILTIFWSIKYLGEVPKSLSQVFTAFRPYCHKSVLVSKDLPQDSSNNNIQFNLLNIHRHSGCPAQEPNSNLIEYNWSPSWLYGTSNSQN